MLPIQAWQLFAEIFDFAKEYLGPSQSKMPVVYKELNSHVPEEIESSIDVTEFLELNRKYGN